MFKRVFLIVLDSLGIGQTSDAYKFGDEKSNTLLHILDGNDNYKLDILERLGLTTLIGKEINDTRGLYMRANPLNLAKDSLNGHYEMMGAISKNPYKTYPDGFPMELITKIEKAIGRKVIGNACCDGIRIINDLGDMHLKTGAIIIYTSCDSVLQVAAHEDIISVEELYNICEAIRKITIDDEYNIARIIARPFSGKVGSFYRLPKRKDYALDPPINMLDLLYRNNINTIAIGKIADMFNNKSINVKIKTKDNIDGIMKLIDFAKGNFEGLLWANLNDFDSDYGHRRDKEGYLKALEEFNYYLPIFLKNLKKDDLIIITADHGCDPTFKGNDHTREMVPILIYSPIFKKGKRLEDRQTFADIGATILDNFNVKNEIGVGESIFNELRNKK